MALITNWKTSLLDSNGLSQHSAKNRDEILAGLLGFVSYTNPSSTHDTSSPPVLEMLTWSDIFSTSKQLLTTRILLSAVDTIVTCATVSHVQDNR